MLYNRTLISQGDSSMATEAQVQKKHAKLEKATAIMRGSVGEPIVTKDNYKVELMLALSWYNANEESSKLSKFGIEYLKKNDMLEYSKYFNEASDHETNQMCILMRLDVRGQYLSDEHKALIKTRLDNIKAKYTQKIAEKVEIKKANPIATVSVDQRVIEVARKHLAEIDFEIDRFCIDKSNDFSLKSYVAKNGLSAAVTKKIGEFYKRLHVELQEAILGTDEDLVEAYSFLTTAQLKKFCNFVNQIIEDSQSTVLAAKANRAPRVRKAKPAAVQVAKMQYLPEFKDLGLTSVHPTKIVDAQQLWVYNVKSKKLGVYYASGSSGFSVKGTSLQGWDPETSSQNSLRKPAVTIKEVMDGGKLQLNKILSKLTTINTKLNGRINADTILLKVL